VSAAAAPSGVVTYLFTDVEGSTRRWEKDPDAMRIALAAHDEVLRGAIEAHGGWLFKHTGDGVCAAFSSPRSAVDAAVTAQRALEQLVQLPPEDRDRLTAKYDAAYARLGAASADGDGRRCVQGAG
jgi:class 3 adenylate cyclase